MATMGYSTIHEEHYEAQSEHGMWLEDIDRWNKEHQQAVVMLERIRAALRNHETALRDHAQTIRSHDVQAQRHEKEILERERIGAASRPEDEIGGSHRRFRIMHERARSAHQRIKEHHDAIMAEIRRLHEKLNSAM
jgi:hypothetical protein